MTDAVKSQLKPFFWVEHEGSCSLCHTIGSFKDEIFLARSNEGFEGNGYDWASLATVFLEEKMPQLKPVIGLDPEADMFCAYSKESAALEQFALAFRALCEDDARMADLFSRAELD